MPANHSVSKSKLHCILVILILFIVVFLSLPLFLINLANDNYKSSTSSAVNETAADQLSANRLTTNETDVNETRANETVANDGLPGEYMRHTVTEVAHICEGTAGGWDASPGTDPN